MTELALVAQQELVPAAGSLDGHLEQLAAEARRKWDETRGHVVDAFELMIEVGSLLSEARRMFASDQHYGRWFKRMGFGFSTEWGRILRLAAEKPDAVREALAAQLLDGVSQNFKRAVFTAHSRNQVATAKPPAEVRLWQKWTAFHDEWRTHRHELEPHQRTRFVDRMRVWAKELTEAT